MKLLDATSISQGQFPSDFSYATEGELVRLGEVRATDLRDPNGDCGCGRAFAGLVSRRATTTAVVTDLDLADAELAAQVATGLTDAGYTSALLGRWAFRGLLQEAVDDMLFFADALARRHRRRSPPRSHPLPPTVTVTVIGQRCRRATR